MLIDGVMLLWFVLTALSVLFVAVDIRTTPENPVMKMGLRPVHRLFGAVRGLPVCPGLPGALAGTP